MIYDILGWSGAAIILLAYYLNETGKLTAKSRQYQLLNLFGAIGILCNALFHRALPSVGLNIIWALIALYELVRLRRNAKK